MKELYVYYKIREAATHAKCSERLKPLIAISVLIGNLVRREVVCAAASCVWCGTAAAGDAWQLRSNCMFC